jgi:hypothetical protein
MSLIDCLFSLFGSKERHTADAFTGSLIFYINRFISFDPTATDKALFSQQIRPL